MRVSMKRCAVRSRETTVFGRSCCSTRSTVLLHMSGHNDKNPDDHQAMHTREDELLKAVGVGAVYHGGQA